ncbi:MAG: fumarylacetoacetate hydrolase family protein [Pseudomonadota bacterium]
MNEQAIDKAAACLRRIRDDGKVLASFPGDAEPNDIEDAYRIQDRLVAALGEKTIGWKVGCTSAMAQEMTNTDEPFYGRMFKATSYQGSASIDRRDVFAPIVEPEIAFRLSRDLRIDDAPFDVDGVLDAVDAIYAAVEIVDCRYAQGWPIPIMPTVADNGVHATFISGDAIADWRSFDRPGISVRVDVEGALEVEGVGANALDDPINGLVWLANRCLTRGHYLKKGEIITTGNLAAAPVFAKPGQHIAATFEGLGKVEVQF